MNFKSSTHLTFNAFLVFSFFANQDIAYNLAGICKIAKITFDGSKNTNEQFCFLEGLSNFCKEKEIKEGDLIAKITNGYQSIHDMDNNDANDDVSIQTTHLQFIKSCFPEAALLTHVDRMYTQKEPTETFVSKRTVIMTQAMQEFVQAMIEKGQPTGENQTATN